MSFQPSVDCLDYSGQDEIATLEPTCHMTSSLEISIESYTFSGEQNALLRNVVATVSQDRTLVLVGPSGSGKSTFLKILLGMEEGVLVGGVSYTIDGRSMKAQEARTNGFVGLFSGLVGMPPWLSVRENILLPQSLNPKLPSPGKDDLEFLLEKAGLSSRVLEQYPHQISFGMLQRVNLIRALSYSPKVLLMDETFTGLDPATAQQVADLIDIYSSKHRAISVLVTHDFHLAAKYGDIFLLIGPDSKSMMIDRELDEATLREQLYLLCTGLGISK